MPVAGTVDHPQTRAGSPPGRQSPAGQPPPPDRASHPQFAQDARSQSFLWHQGQATVRIRYKSAHRSGAAHCSARRCWSRSSYNSSCLTVPGFNTSDGFRFRPQLIPFVSPLQAPFPCSSEKPRSKPPLTAPTVPRNRESRSRCPPNYLKWPSSGDQSAKSNFTIHAPSLLRNPLQTWPACRGST